MTVANHPLSSSHEARTHHTPNLATANALDLGSAAKMSLLLSNENIPPAQPSRVAKKHVEK